MGARRQERLDSCGEHTITAEDFLPDDAQDALNKLRDNRQQPH